MVAAIKTLFCSVTVLAIGVGTAHAQTAASSTTGGALEELVVTAQRRQERLLDVPISVTALTADRLASFGGGSAQALEQLSPSLTAATGAFVPQIQIRGVGGRNANVGDEATVPIYIDGIYQPFMYSAYNQFNSIARIEILRGPQGTLFGRNALGGAINVITRTPSFTPSGTVAIGGANDHARRADIYATAGLSDTVAMDASGLYRDGGDYVKDVVSGRKLAGLFTGAGRIKTYFRPSDTFEATVSLGASYSEDNSALAYQALNGNTVGRAAAPSAPLPSAPFQSALSFEPLNKQQQVSGGLNLRWKQPQFYVESLTGYQHNRLHVLSDTDGSLPALASIDNLSLNDNINSTAQIVSDQPGAKVSWIVGVFAMHDNSRYDPIIINGVTRLNSRLKTLALAGFGEATLALPANFKLTGGLRYNSEKKSFLQFQNGVLRNNQSRTWRNLTPRVVLRNQVTPDTNVYVSYSEGFKSGVWNTASTLPDPVQPEKLKAIELGVKSRPTPRLQVAASIFHYGYTNLQINARDATTGSSILQNAATAKIKGAELELDYAATDWLKLNLGASYLDAKFGRFPSAIVNLPKAGGGNTTVTVDASGRANTRSPKTKLNLGAVADVPVPLGKLQLAGNLAYSASYTFDPIGRVIEPATTLVNANLAWTLPGEHWRLELWGTNLTDKRYFIVVNESASGDTAALARPRTYGATIRRSW